MYCTFRDLCIFLFTCLPQWTLSSFFVLLLFLHFQHLHSIDLLLVSLRGPFLLGCQGSLSSCCTIWSHQARPGFSPLSSALKCRPLPANEGYAALVWPGGGESVWLEGRCRLWSSLYYQLPGELPHHRSLEASVLVCVCSAPRGACYRRVRDEVID